MKIATCSRLCGRNVTGRSDGATSESAPITPRQSHAET